MINKNKNAQVTIFIILGLILVVIIAILFLLIRGPDVVISDEENPQAFIDTCTREAVEEAVEILMLQGGDLIPKGSVMYEGQELVFLCYNSKYYESCVNQRPLLIEYMQDEITEYVRPRINNCFQTLNTQLESRYDVSMGDMELSTKLETEQISININRDFTVVRGDNVREFDNFKINLVHPLYDLAKIAMEISNQEAHYCNFDTLGFMIIYPRYDIIKFRMGDSNTVYTITDLNTNQEFKFAIRSCALPAGF